MFILPVEYSLKFIFLSRIFAAHLLNLLCIIVIYLFLEWHWQLLMWFTVVCYIYNIWTFSIWGSQAHSWKHTRKMFSVTSFLWEGKPLVLLSVLVCGRCFVWKQRMFFTGVRFQWALGDSSLGFCLLPERLLSLRGNFPEISVALLSFLSLHSECFHYSSWSHG